MLRGEASKLNREGETLVTFHVTGGREEAIAWLKYVIASLDRVPSYDRLPDFCSGHTECPNCSDHCIAVSYCDGCEMVLCEECWSEHNEDGPCHDD